MKEKLEVHSEKRTITITGSNLADVFLELKEGGVECTHIPPTIFLKKKYSSEAWVILQKYRGLRLKTRTNIYRDSILNLQHLVKTSGLKGENMSRLLGIPPRRVRRLISGDTKLTPEDLEDFAALFGVDPGKLTFDKNKQFLLYLQEMQWEKKHYTNVSS